MSGVDFDCDYLYSTTMGMSDMNHTVLFFLSYSDSVDAVVGYPPVYFQW